MAIPQELAEPVLRDDPGETPRGASNLLYDAKHEIAHQ
jgi:hypothetical protein